MDYRGTENGESRENAIGQKQHGSREGRYKQISVANPMPAWPQMPWEQPAQLILWLLFSVRLMQIKSHLMPTTGFNTMSTASSSVCWLDPKSIQPQLIYTLQLIP